MLWTKLEVGETIDGKLTSDTARKGTWASYLGNIFLEWEMFSETRIAEPETIDSWFGIILRFYKPIIVRILGSGSRISCPTFRISPFELSGKRGLPRYYHVLYSTTSAIASPKKRLSLLHHKLKASRKCLDEFGLNSILSALIKWHKKLLPSTPFHSRKRDPEVMPGASLALPMSSVCWIA